MTDAMTRTELLERLFQLAEPQGVSFNSHQIRSWSDRQIWIAIQDLQEVPMPDPMTEAVAKTLDSMATIDQIVRDNFDDPETMAAMLNEFADVNDHRAEWVAKKAHDAIRSITWTRFNAPLNEAMGLHPDYVG